MWSTRNVLYKEIDTPKGKGWEIDIIQVVIKKQE